MNELQTAQQQFNDAEGAYQNEALRIDQQRANMQAEIMVIDAQLAKSTDVEKTIALQSRRSALAVVIGNLGATLGPLLTQRTATRSHLNAIEEDLRSRRYRLDQQHTALEASEAEIAGFALQRDEAFQRYSALKDLVDRRSNEAAATRARIEADETRLRDASNAGVS